MKIVKDVYNISQKLPESEKFNLISQITRAAVSIPSNIAEGCTKSSEREFKLYLERALGSAFELETQIMIVSTLNNLDVQELITTIQSEQRKLGSFISSVKNRLPKT